MIFVNIALIVQAIASINVSSDEDIHGQTVIRRMRVNMIICIFLNLLELFSRIRIFDFFAYFVRQLQEICIDAMPLGTMLAFIVLAQTLIFWILD